MAATATTTQTTNPTQKTLDTIVTCRSLLSDVSALRKASQWSPAIYQQLYFILSLLELNITKTRDFIHHEGSAEDVDLAVKITSVSDVIEEKVAEIVEVLKNVKVALELPKWKAIFSSANIPWREPRVRETTDKIMTEHVLLLRAGAPPLSSAEIADVAEKTKIAMDWRTEEYVTDLKAYQRGSISGPAGMPNGLGEVTLTSDNVRRPSTFYNVYGGRIIGTINTDAGPIPQVIEGVTPKPLTAAEEVLQKTVSRPGPAILQFESPHLGGLTLTTSVPDMHLSLPDGDPARSNSVNSSQLPPPADPSEALSRVLREIRNAKVDAWIYPGISLQVYRKALRIINSIADNSSPEILFFKGHYATVCEIGLSSIESPPSVHLGKALKINERTLALAESLKNLKLVARATLDKAQIKDRTALVQERTGMASKNTTRSISIESFQLFSSVIDMLRGNCEGLSDHHILAQALLGCGKVSRRVISAAGGGSHHHHHHSSHSNGPVTTASGTTSAGVGGLANLAGMATTSTANSSTTNATTNTPPARSSSTSKRFSISALASSRRNSSTNVATAAILKADPVKFLEEALETVEQGIAVGKAEDESDEALEEVALVSEDVRKQLSFMGR